MARQRRTFDDQIVDLVTRSRTERFNSLGTEGLSPIGSDHIEEGAIDGGHIKEGAINPIAFSPEVRQTFDDLESGLQENEIVQRELGERIKELKEITLPSLDGDLKAAEKRIADSVKNRLDPIDAGMAALENQQVTLSQGIIDLRDKTLPALRVDLAAAQTRLNAADVLLNDSFPKRIAAAEGSASNAATRATAAETAAAKAAADLVTAKTRADNAAAAATTANAAAAAAEASSVRATGAAGVAETAADTARQSAIDALAQAQNAGGNVSTAQAAAKAAQDAANTAKAQATTAGTAAAAADAKAAQAAADAAQAAADALVSQQQATKSAGEATTAKGEAAAAKTASAAAEAAAVTAKTRADTAAANATTAATKATAAETSATKASGAAGVAETAADTARQNAAAALTQAQNSGSNATAAQNAATAAQTAANTAKSQATTAGTAAAAADAAAAQAAADAAKAAADLIVARNAAADARGDADTALDRADDAVRQAGSAARVLYSTGNPSGTARVGDTWRKTNGDAGDIIAEWRYTKVGTAAASWKPQELSTDMISNLDVGKLSAGSAAINSLVAEKVALATATIQKADIGNLTVTGASKMNTLVAEKVGAAVGEFVHIDIGTGTFGEMEGGRIKAGSISTNQMLVGSFSNLLENGSFEFGNKGWGNSANWTFSATEGRLTPGCLKVTGITARVFGPTSNINIPIETGDSYRLSGYVRTTATSGHQGELCYYWYAGDGSFMSNKNLNITTATSAWTAKPFSMVFEPPAGAAFLRIRINATMTKASDVMYFDDIALVKASDGSLIVNGSIIGNHIDGQSVAAEVGTFVKADVKNLVVTGTTKLNTAVAERIAADTGTFIELNVDQLRATGGNFQTAVADKMFSNIFATRKLMASQVYIGEGGNIFPSDFMDSAWQKTAGVVYSASGGRAGGTSVLVPAATTQTGAYYGIASADRDKLPRVIPGDSYRIKANVRSDKIIPKGGAALYARLYDGMDKNVTSYTWATPSNVSNDKAIPANTWGVVEGIITVPDGADNALAPGVYAQATATGAIRFSEFSIVSAIAPGMVVDGLMDAKRIVGASIETVDEANQGIKLTAAKGIQVFNSSGKEMLRANTNGVEAAGAFTADSQTGKVVMTGNIPGQAQPSRLEHGLQFYSAADALQGQIYSGYGHNGVVVRGPSNATSLSVGSTSISLSAPGAQITANNGDISLSGKTTSISHGAIPERRIPLGILGYWESSAQISVKSSATQIWAGTLTIPASATIRVTVHLRGYPTANDQVTMIHATAAGVTFGAHFHDTGLASLGADATISFTYNSPYTTDRAVAFRVLGTVAVGGTAAQWIIPAKTADSQTEIVVEDLGTIP